MKNLNRFNLNKTWCVICYDIVENRRRTRVMKLLKGYGFHVQKSVFECLLNSSALDKLLKKLEKEIDGETDSIRAYLLCDSCRGQVVTLGTAEVIEAERVRVI